MSIAHRISFYLLEEFLETILVWPAGIMKLLLRYENCGYVNSPETKSYPKLSFAEDLLEVNVTEITTLYVCCDKVMNILNVGGKNGHRALTGKNSVIICTEISAC
jgi:hypothetical protein